MRGKLTIVGILLVAMAAAGFAWWYRANTQLRIREFWGLAGLQTIDAAARVEAFENTHSLGGTAIPAEQTFVDISQQKGLIHARHSLLEEASFDWQPNTVVSPDFTWQRGVRFSSSQNTVTVLFDFSSQDTVYVELNKQQRLSAETAADWQDYLERRATSPPAEKLPPGKQSPGAR